MGLLIFMLTWNSVISDFSWDTANYILIGYESKGESDKKEGISRKKKVSSEM